MKVFAIISLVIASVNLIAFFVLLGSNPEFAPPRLGAAGMFGVIGAYLLKRARDKERQEIEKKKWNEGGKR